MVATSFCGLLTAAERVGDVDRVSEWTEAIRRILLDPTGGRPAVLRIHCSIALGGVLVQAGRWSEAEALLQASLAGGGPGARHAPGGRRRSAGRPSGPPRARRRSRGVAPSVRGSRRCRGAPDCGPSPQRRAGAGGGRGETGARPARRRCASDGAVALVAGRRGAPLRGAGRCGRRSRPSPRGGSATASRSCWRCWPPSPPDGSPPRRATWRKGSVGSRNATRRLADAERPDLLVTTHLDLADAYAELGDRGAAVASARAAHAGAERLTATPLRDRAASTLRRLGASAPRPAVVRAAVLGELTTREREVLDGLGQGETNAQIAARLIRPPRRWSTT